ncbi:MAG: Ku protein, partial [Flavisolibacter sp.]|nr:Ku protein [Flavisolibacter sp.]
FNPAAFKDDYIDALKKVIKAKAAGKQIRIAEPEEKPVTVKDLMEVLKQSLDKTKKRA